MGFLVKFDAKGKEIGREPLKRGRPPKGSVRQDNGDIHLVVDANAPVSAASPVAIVEEKDEVAEKDDEGESSSVEEVVVASAPPRRTKTAEKPVSLEWFLRCCYPTNKVILGPKIVLENPTIIGDTGIPDVRRTSTYNRIEIDTVANSVSLWGPPGPPKVVVNQAFSQE